MRRGKWGLREQTEIVDNVDKSVQNSIFPKKGKKWVCKTYPQNWGQNVDNVDNKKVEHIFCATCLVYHKVGGLCMLIVLSFLGLGIQPPTPESQSHAMHREYKHVHWTA